MPSRPDRWLSVLDEDLGDVTLETMLAAVKREVALRANVYAKRVAAGLMTQDEADRETRAMRAVLKRLLVEQQRLERQPQFDFPVSFV